MALDQEVGCGRGADWVGGVGVISGAARGGVMRYRHLDCSLTPYALEDSLSFNRYQVNSTGLLVNINLSGRNDPILE